MTQAEAARPADETETQGAEPLPGTVADGSAVGREAEGEAGADETGPLRRCLVTRLRQPKERMIRFVVGPDGTLVADLAGRLPGRGLWLSARADVLDKARAQRAFARAVRGEVVVPPDLAATIAAGLARRLLDLIGLARRAGQAVAGFEKAREWLASGRVGLLVEASDGAAEGREKLRALAPAVPVVAPLPAAVLGQVFGRDHAVHVVLAPGRLAAQVAAEAVRLEGFAGPEGTAAPDWIPARGGSAAAAEAIGEDGGAGRP